MHTIQRRHLNRILRMVTIVDCCVSYQSSQYRLGAPNRANGFCNYFCCLWVLRFYCGSKYQRDASLVHEYNRKHTPNIAASTCAPMSGGYDYFVLRFTILTDTRKRDLSIIPLQKQTYTQKKT